MDSGHPERIAIVGSGMAGLVTAWLLRQDPKRRFEVVLYESGDRLSLDSASVSISNPSNGHIEHVDLPMRAFAGNFYSNLRAMYDYLEIDYHAQPFVFDFVKSTMGENRSRKSRAYFVHSSNNHILPPIKPDAMPLLVYVVEVFYLLVCYAWFTVCCFCVAPVRAAGKTKDLPESLGQYLERIRLPQYFISYYVLPLMSSVATCTHTELLDFPASDLVDYKRTTNAAQHYTVSNGVWQVQQKLSKGIDVRFCARVTSVETNASGSKVEWINSARSGPPSAHEEYFDKVILAISPDVAQAIFKPLNDLLSGVPTVQVESVVHRKSGSVESRRDDKHKANKSRAPLRALPLAQNIKLRTSSGKARKTESIHEQPSGVLVTTCPFTPIPKAQVIQSSKFVRVLRTPESKQIVNNIFRSGSEHEPSEKDPQSWRSGDGGVYLVGSWCWDGMVLLEGCIVSAMRVADALSVDVPWRSV